MNPPYVSVIVVNWNGCRYLGDCLASLRRQSFKDLEIILVDNASTDNSVAFVRHHYPEVILLPQTSNLGFAAANNRGIHLARGSLIALLNNDAVAAEDWLAQMVAALEANPKAGSAASKMLFRQHPHIIDRVGDAYTLAGAGQLRGRGASADAYQERQWILGPCAGAAVYRRSMLNDIGLFDEDFFLLYEDLDLSLRACLKGYPCIFVPQAIVYHAASLTIGRDSPISIYYGHRNLEWTYIQNLPLPVLLLTVWPHLLYGVASWIYFQRLGYGKVFWRAKRDAIKGLRPALAKRQQVQALRRVSASRIWRLLTVETFLGRWQQRKAK